MTDQNSSLDVLRSKVALVISQLRPLLSLQEELEGISSLSNRMGEIKKSITDLENSRDELKSQVTHLTIQRDRLKKDVQRRIKEVEDDAALTKQRHDILLAGLEESHQRVVGDQQKELQDLLEQKEQAGKELSDLQVQKSALEDSIQLLTDKVAELKEKLANW